MGVGVTLLVPNSGYFSCNFSKSLSKTPTREISEGPHVTESIGSGTLPRFLASEGFIPKRKNILESEGLVASDRLNWSSSQKQIDQFIENFLYQATDWKSFAAMTAASFAYRLGKISLLSAQTLQDLPLVGPTSVGIGLVSEATAYEFSQRSLSTFFPTEHSAENPNVWRFSGGGGWKEGWVSSLASFGTLKGLGKIAEEGNLLYQHALQDLGIVATHQWMGQMGITEVSTGSFAEQMLEAEIMNLHMGAGIALGHSLSEGKFLASEKALDLKLRFFDSGRIISFPSEPFHILRTLCNSSKSNSEATTPESHPDQIQTSFMGIGLAGLLRGTFPGEGLFENLEVWQRWGLLGLGIATATGVGLWAYGKFWKKPPPRWHESPPYSQLRLPLSEEEREVLRPFFKNQSVPKILTGKEWQLIEDRLFGGSLILVGKKVEVRNRKFWDLWGRVDQHLLKIKKGLIRPEDSEGDFEGNWETSIIKSRTVISFSERMEEVERGIPDTYRVYLKEFKMGELGDVLRGLFKSANAEVRENAARVYYYHVRQLAKPDPSKISEDTLNEILTGAKALKELRRDPVLNVRSVSAANYLRVLEYLPPGYRQLLE
jgi:hypothetical protein